MNNKQNNNNCYVFSQATLDQALSEWVKIKSEKDIKNEEKYLITAEALTWFLKHFNHSPSIYSFTDEELQAELKSWKSAQIESYPHQKKRINESCKYLLSFFESEIVINHKMTVHA